MWNSNLAKMILPLGLLIAGCGGGGGGGGSAPDTAPSGANPPPAVEVPADSAPPTTTDPGSDDGLEAISFKSGPCAATYTGSFALVEGQDASKPLSGFAKPAKGKPYNDPVYGSCIVRATDADAEGLSGFARNDYARRQPFNADDSRFIVYSRGQSWYLYDTQTLKLIKKLDLNGAGVEPQWHPTHPDVMYVIPNGGGMTITEYNVATGEKNVVTDFTRVQKIAGHDATSIKQIWPSAAKVSTKTEGSPSMDARWWGLVVLDSNNKGLGMISYDMLKDEIAGVYDFAKDGGGVPAPDHISISATGEYVVPSWSSPACSGGSLGTRSKPCGMMSFSRDFNFAIGLAPKSPHSDLGLDADGRDVVIAGDYDSGWVRMWDLANGQSTNLWQIYTGGNSTAMHLSARNFYKPGWVLISTYKEKVAGSGWYANKVMAVELKPNPRILNLAHTYNKGGDYFSEPHAAVNRDFTKVLFNSNWNSGNDDNVDTYMIELPADTVPAL